MTDVDTFLGEIVARVIRTLINHSHPGVRLQHVTAFNPETMLKNLNVEPKPRIAIAGASITELVRKTKYPTVLLTSDLAEATEWRNDPKVSGTVVIVSFGEEERLGSFHRFTEIRDHDLYREICETAFKEICPNDVQMNWWSVLAKAEIRRQISVFRLASYFLHLKAKPKQIPEAARDGLYLLGLLPSKEFFEHPTPAQLLRNINNNRQLTNRIEILNNADRDRLNRGIEIATDADRPKLLATLGKVLKYNRSGSDLDRAALVAEEVRALFEAKKSAPKTKTQKVIPIERAGVDAILEGDEQELTQLGKKLRATIKGFEEDETPNITLDLTNRSEQAAAKIPPPLVHLLARVIACDRFGGKFKFQNSDSLAAALGDIDNAEFTPFGLEGDKSCRTLLKMVIATGLIEPEVLERWQSFVEFRATLAEQAVAIAISPMVALASDKKLLQAGKDYLNAYEGLMGAIRDRYEAVASQSAQGARLLCAQLLVLDTILFETSNSVYAMLSPLHPLHLCTFGSSSDSLNSCVTRRVPSMTIRNAYLANALRNCPTL